MPRKKRKIIKFTEESANDLLQEIYEDSYNIRAKIIRLFNKWEIKVKEGGEIAAFGEQIIKLINAEAKNQDQKIMLLKYIKDFINKENNSKDKDEEAGEISATDKAALLKMVKDSVGN
jgi:hypothetical protein